MIRSWLAIGLAWLTIGGCTGDNQSQASTVASAAVPTVLSNEEEILEATLNYLTADSTWAAYWSGEDLSTSFFLEVGGQDPPPALLAKFPTLRPSSDCVVTPEGVFATGAGEPGHLYSLDSPEKLTPTRARVRFFLKSVGWGGGGATLTLELIEGAWKVTDQGPIIKA